MQAPAAHELFTRAEAILLDALGTLVELEPPAPLLRAELRDRFAIEVTLEEARSAIEAEIAFYRAHLDEGRDQGSLAGLRRRCGEVMRSALPSPERLAEVDPDVTTAALMASLRFRAFDEVVPALELARAGGRRLIVVSNWDVSLHEVFERVGIARLIDGVLTSAQVGARKPAPVIFEQALELAGFGAADALHVGDSVAEDVAGARAAGIQAVLLRRDGAPGPAGVTTIASLAELVAA